MYRHTIAEAIICLSNAFDFAETPQGGPFWEDVKRRLIDYHDHAPREGRGNPKDAPHTAHLTTFSLKGVAPIGRGEAYGSIKHGFAWYFGQSLGRAFTWSETHEGQAYWNKLAQAFNQTECRDTDAYYRVLDQFPDAALCLPQFETYSLRGAKVSSFARELGYHWRPFMFPHHDPEDPTLVRYIPPNKPTLSKHWVTSKPGKFLKSYYSHAFTDEQIASLAAKFRADGLPPELILATTAAEIKKVFNSGPDSCMKGKSIDGHSPTEAYASPDFAVAYIEREGKPTARAVVCPSKKLYIRIYGDSAVFKPILERAGYKEARAPGTGGHTDPDAAKALTGMRLAAVHAKTKRPAVRKLEEAGEPILITPFFDLAMDAYYDRTKDALILHARDGSFPKRYHKHGLAGGYSLHAISKEDPIPRHPNSPGHFITQIGASGRNETGALTFDEAGRAP